MAPKKPNFLRGTGGETHQTNDDQPLTTNQGTPVSDDQNSLKSGARGPVLLEDFHLREKITHFDHERIPERIVHARGSGAHGYFQPYESMASVTRAAFLQDPKVKTPVFVRFSTVAGGPDSVDTPRDVRGFAVKFYTQEGNFDLVGNNIPVFFIQDAMKFPDIIHAVKKEPDRGYPVAGSAHDTFWDFVSLMPETMHMLMWVMSDRAIPRSLRTIDGFGVHTFKLINAKGKMTFVKFHWRPKLGLASVVWDESLKLQAADNDFHRRDLFESIAAGHYPEWELAFQLFDEKTAAKLDFDYLDATKVIPEEVVPLTLVGKMVLDRNPDNFFAETEQVAFHPGHLVPGIDFTEDPLLAGRLHSYTDTQLSRLGGPNFHELEINKPKCPFHNFQVDGIHRQQVAKGRVQYEPSTLEPGPRESPRHGFVTHPQADVGPKVRQRPESFADHYSQARQHFISLSEHEQRHIIAAFAFELGKVETVEIRARMLGHLDVIHEDLGAAVADKLGMSGQAQRIAPKVPPKELPACPSFSMADRAPRTLTHRKLGVLVTDGTDAKLFAGVKQLAAQQKATLVVVAPKVGGVTLSDGKKLKADAALDGAPSAVFDAVALVPSKEGCALLLQRAAAVDWVRDAFGHLKVIACSMESGPLLTKAGIPDEPDEGVVPIDGTPKRFKNVGKALANYRIWDREPSLR